MEEIAVEAEVAGCSTVEYPAVSSCTAIHSAQGRLTPVQEMKKSPRLAVGHCPLPARMPTPSLLDRDPAKAGAPSGSRTLTRLPASGGVWVSQLGPLS